jgi:two-component system, OmpR family, sensor histidine kinase KdpD
LPDYDRRPDPDALLALTDRETQGKLRVFLGAAPGVGKTYAMLSRARAAKAMGVDVVVGLAETHGRAETEALLEGLEILPRRRIDYKGRTVEEFDIDAALARKPQLLVLDELAHSNAPESRHPKRWQDAEELLRMGVDVWTALNVQHLESLADVVTRITGVTVRETVPDRILQDANEVILVDITPDELLQRLREGKVYVPETARRATQNFFTPRNLTALRELALRRTADRVDDQMVDFLRQGAIEGPWGTSERLLVCIGREPASTAVVRAAARLATGLDASWIAIHVEASNQRAPSAEAVKATEAALRLAERLGAEVERLVGDDLVDEVLKFARRENITQVVLGRSRVGRLPRLLSRSFTEEIVGRAEDIAVHVVIHDEGRVEPPQKRRLRLASNWKGYAAAVASVALTVALGHVLDRALQPSSLSVIFLLPVVYCAVRFGRASAIGAALLSFFACDFFFVEPRYAFSISEPQEFLALIVSLIVAMITGTLASRMREQAQDMRRRAQTTQSLFDFSSRLSAAQSLDEALWAATGQIQKALASRAVVLLVPQEGELEMRAAWPPRDALDPGEASAARWALEKGEAAGWRTHTLPSVRFQFRPLATARGVIAVCGVEPLHPNDPFSTQEEQTLTSLIEQTAVALDRSLLVGESVRAAALEENEKLRTTLLASLSHDLRTPLTSILGAVTSLRELGDRMPPADRDDLLLSIEEEAGRLSRFIANLLDMSRIESGALAPRREPVDVAAVVREVAERARRALPGLASLQLSLAPNLPPIQGDAQLLGQVLFNLVDNAHKYGGETGAIIHARREGDELVVTVTDEGPGVKPADLERIFEKFYRSGRVDGRKAGTGLGLSICRGLVTAMGGTIVAQSPAVRRGGTRIVMRFPIPAATEKGRAI